VDRRSRAKRKRTQVRNDREERGRRERERAVKAVERQSAARDPFKKFWNEWVDSRRHLDALLADLPRNKKTLWAPRIQALLRIPVSLAQELGIGIGPGEPWCFDFEALREWEGAERIFRALEENPEIARGLALDPSLGAEVVQNLTVAGSTEDYPPKLIEAWEKDWGGAIAGTLARELAKPPGVSLRVRVGEDRDAIRKELEARKDSLSTLSPVGIRFEGYRMVMGTKAFERGAYEIQDEGSQLLALAVLAPEKVLPMLSDEPGVPTPAFQGSIPKKGLPALTVVDACAGAGGKTLALADLKCGRVLVFAYDVFESKIAALRRRIGKAQLTNAKALLLESGNEEAKLADFIGKADAVLVDAPCSGWGVLRRNPDTKWKEHLSKDSDANIARLPDLQLRLLELYSRLVRPGGRLVYSLCTFRKAETEGVVSRFENAHPEFRALGGGYLGPSQTDGFYLRAWEKAAR
jgi:16S rRNA C967 or C1407 C5-methylase (RsmB/RsmF family)